MLLSQVHTPTFICRAHGTLPRSCELSRSSGLASMSRSGYLSRMATLEGGRRIASFVLNLQIHSSKNSRDGRHPASRLLPCWLCLLLAGQIVRFFWVICSNTVQNLSPLKLQAQDLSDVHTPAPSQCLRRHSNCC
jgi:hypothetical protein